MRAVVFAYHNVGERCLQVLLARGVEIALVVTHEDNPAETIWFASVAQLCARHEIPCMAPSDPTSPELLARVREAQPDFIFSFYYRHMLPVALLQSARCGAFNMHGSLLPKYRGRVPVNWAVLHGEAETGATLHEMVARPDAGAIVGQTAVPILPDDTAHDVFGKVVVAAEQTLWRVLPAMLGGHIPRTPNDLAKGSYYGARSADHGLIDWQQPAQAVYNLVRAVAPPYPGAWTVLGGQRLVIARARLMTAHAASRMAEFVTMNQPNAGPGLQTADGRIIAICGDGGMLEVHDLRLGEAQLDATGLASLRGAGFPPD